MPAHVEIDFPDPGDHIGLSVDVGGTYDLGYRSVDKAIPANTRIECRFQTPAGVEIDMQPFPITAYFGPWSVHFTFTQPYVDHRFEAKLIEGSANLLDTDIVSDID